MKILIKKILFTASSLINKIVYKRNRIMIYGGNYLDDNSEAMFRYIISKNEFDVVCVAKDHLVYNKTDRIKYVKDSYLNALYYMFTSKVVLDSSYHTVMMKPSKKQLFIQMWHGIPLKYMNGNSSPINYSQYFSMFFSPSPNIDRLMLQTFGAAKDKLITAGYPRCDYLFESAKNCELLRNHKINIVWMPTYKHGLGISVTNKTIPILTDENVSALDKMLVHYDICIYIKPHRLEKEDMSVFLSRNNVSNIVLITDDDLKRSNIPVYKFLGGADALITDYSSVFYDYLLLDRPIGFTIDDFDEYKSKVGFIFDNPTSYMPGELITDIDGFMKFINDVAVGNDQYRNDRHRVNEYVNHYKDGCNSMRCYNMIKRFIENGITE